MSSNISSDSRPQREQSLSPPRNTMLSSTDLKVSEKFTGNYPYQPLQSDGHVRLLLLEPPASSSTQDIPVISATLHEVNLSVVGETPCPSYKALSYEWGLPPSNPSETPTMLLDNYTIHIRQNLYDALHSILHNHHQLYGESPLYLWVDALCINQLDDQEKGHQVRLMKGIYETAEIVIIWLGMGTEHTDEAMELINLGEEELCRCVDEQSLTSREQYGLWSLLCEATYWKRVWILQEFVLARDYVILCNRALATKEYFERALKILIIFGLRRPLLWVLRPNGQRNLHDSPVLRIIELRDSRMHSQTTLDDWVNATCGKKFKATDPRDYIFALLGISHDGDSIVPDYELSPWEVYLLTMSPRSPMHIRTLLWGSYLADLMGISKDRARDVWDMHSSSALQGLPVRTHPRGATLCAPTSRKTLECRYHFLPS